MTVYDNQSLARGFKILECLANSTEPLPVAEVARRTGLHRATAHRMLTVLVQLGYVHKSSDTALYTTAFYLHTFGHLDHIVPAIRRHAAPFLRQLSASLGGERVSLGYLEGPHVAICDVIPGDGEQERPHLQTGARRDAHATAIGKALMSLRPVDEIRQRYQDCIMATRGPRTIRRIDLLLEELRDVKRRGYAVDDCESAADMRGVAAPILNPAGRATCAVAIEAPKSRLDMDLLHRHGALAIATARKITDYMVNSGRDIELSARSARPAADKVVRFRPANRRAS